VLYIYPSRPMTRHGALSIILTSIEEDERTNGNGKKDTRRAYLDDEALRALPQSESSAEEEHSTSSPPARLAAPSEEAADRCLVNACGLLPPRRPAGDDDDD
jgi:hypothetical protein